MSKPLVSIVTPVYNNAEFLAECIESVLRQTYTNWDYTIVDNCSSDASAEIAYSYSKRDSRIRICQNEQFLPALANHNLALRQISPESKYCKIVFGDDWIYPECIEQMVTLAENHPTVSIVGAYALEGAQVRWTGLPVSTPVVSGREICRNHLLKNMFVFGTANSVLYRADIVRSRPTFYNESHIHADDEVCFELLKNCEFGFVHQILSFTRPRTSSLSTISGDLQTNLPGRLHILLTYGPTYLTGKELKACLNRHLSNYYKFLGKSLLLRRDNRFWEYHRTQLAEAGIGFSQARLIKGLLLFLADAMLNPKDSIVRSMKHKE